MATNSMIQDSELYQEFSPGLWDRKAFQIGDKEKNDVSRTLLPRTSNSRKSLVKSNPLLETRSCTRFMPVALFGGDKQTMLLDVIKLACSGKSSLYLKDSVGSC
jgi:hypothetical protein